MSSLPRTQAENDSERLRAAHDRLEWHRIMLRQIDQPGIDATRRLDLALYVAHIDGILATMPPRHRRLLTAIYVKGADPAAAYAELGLNCQDGQAMLRGALLDVWANINQKAARQRGVS